MPCGNRRRACFFGYRLDFYVEGRDYGGGKIYAYITYKRLYNADEWERRGKLIRTHYYEPDNNSAPDEFNPKKNPFNFSVALQDLFDSSKKGQLYYAAVVHFADNSYAVSDVKSAVLF